VNVSRHPVAVVTGGRAGIGWAIATRLRNSGFQVVVTSRHSPDAAAEAGIRSVLIDHLEPDSSHQLAEDIASHEGRVDVLVNNVGRRQNESIGEFQPDELLAGLALNLASPLLVTSALVPLFGPTGGAIINISSRLASAAIAGVSAYAAAKGGLNAFTRAAAVELADRHIRVNTVAPGMTRTAMIEGWLDSQSDPDAALHDTLASIPLGRLADTGDVASVVAFLASERAAYLTGALIPVDGGFTAA